MHPEKKYCAEILVPMPCLLCLAHMRDSLPCWCAGKLHERLLCDKHCMRVVLGAALE